MTHLTPTALTMVVGCAEPYARLVVSTVNLASAVFNMAALMTRQPRSMNPSTWAYVLPRTAESGGKIAQIMRSVSPHLSDLSTADASLVGAETWESPANGRQTV